MGFGKQLLKGLGEGLTSALTGLPGSLFGAGLSFAGGAIGNYFERKSLDYQAELNEQAAVNAYNRQLDFWNKQNAYNDPSSQVSRLRAAGLNPAMLNGNGVNNTAGNLSSVPQSSPGSPGGAKPNPISDALSLAQVAYNVKQMGFLDEQTANAIEQRITILVDRQLKQFDGIIKLTQAEKEKLDYHAMYEAMYGTAVDGGPITIKNNEYTERINAARAEIALKDAQKEVQRTLSLYQEAQTSLTQYLEEYQRNEDVRRDKESAAKVAADYANAAAAYSTAKLNEAQAAKVAADDMRAEWESNMRRQTEYLKQQGLISENEMKEMEQEIEELWNQGVFKLLVKGDFDGLQKLQSDFLHRNLRFGGEVTRFGK